MTKFSLENQELKPKQIQGILRSVFAAKGHPQPICICGKPGLGKSQIIQQVCKEFGVSYENGNYHEIRASLVVDSSDLVGLPIINKKIATDKGVTREFDQTMKYSVPDVLPVVRAGMTEEELNKTHVIFFDEINRSSDPAVMNAIFQLTTEYRVGPHQLLPNTIVFLALNPEAEGYLVNSMDPALINRICFLFMNTDFFDWKEYAESKGFFPGVIDFLNDNKDMLSHDGILKNEGQDKRFPSPRAWENVSKAIGLFNFDFTTKNKEQQNIAFKVISGIVGYEAATKFVSFMRTNYDDRPLSGDEVASKYIASTYMQNKVRATDNKGMRTYDTTKVQITLDGIKNIVMKNKDKVTNKQLLNILAFMCDIPVEQSLSFQNVLISDIDTDFTNWFFTKVSSNDSLSKLWKTLQTETKKFSVGRKASAI